ncbi:alpha/beta hydrolase family protein [Streptomyces akebiae]|uniref:Uncharacterized protein n=1 Tax=Streptomyces akebiae TaxID=2865673 RepID=A0ABX8XGZ5_9ACTN|nr:hypothetical protein [Streptomyces akebiae]QYX75190.1 hypothetical protein K1J60_00495 [Streptomyces akebiae]
MAFHTGYGHTAVVAEAVARGAAGTGAEVLLISVDTITDGQWAQLDAAGRDHLRRGDLQAPPPPPSTRSPKPGGRGFSHAWLVKPAAGFTDSGAESGAKSSTLKALSAFDQIPELLTQPMLLVAENQADTKVFSGQAYELSKGPKELLVMDGATRIAMYDRADEPSWLGAYGAGGFLTS